MKSRSYYCSLRLFSFTLHLQNKYNTIMRYIIILLITLYSCSANWHLNKAVKKGAELKTITETKHDTTWISEHHYTIDTSSYQHTIVKYVPQTRWKTRIETKYLYKTNRDSLRHVEKLYRDSIQVEKKKLSVEKNKNNRLNRFMYSLMAFFIILLIIYILGKTLVERLLK